MIINVLLALMIIASFLAAIALHEFGHALAASWLGDTTPQAEGRQTLSLRAHLDPVGTLMCVLLAFQPIVGMGFGWGKPVKPDPWKMRVGANAGILTIAWAGMLFSLLIGLLTALIVRFAAPFLDHNIITVHLLQLLIVFAAVNISITLFNLLPFYPLDGYQIVYTLLPSRQAVQFAKSAPYGPFIILAVFFFVPFLVRLASPALANFPLFQLANYILLGAQSLIALVINPTHFGDALYMVSSLYIQP
jgi:Zn-dependent protease